MRLNAPDLQRTAQGTVPVMPIGLHHFVDDRAPNEVEYRYYMYVHVGTVAGVIKNGVGKKGRNCVLFSMVHIQPGTTTTNPSQLIRTEQRHTQLSPGSQS